jgi:hypothetical protein
MASRNRNAGHGWERECRELLLRYFPNVKTSRAESKSRDDEKVDLCNTGHLNIQCKNVCTRVNYVDLLNEMPDEEGQINMIFEKKTRKTPSGRFLMEGKYVHLRLEDMLKLMDIIHLDTDRK